MDKVLVHAIAGSGKTTTIINSLNEEHRIVIITYTTNNQKLLRQEILKHFGYIPKNIKVYGLWEFLYKFCFLPFENIDYKGIIFDDKIIKILNPYNRKARAIVNRYIISNQLSKYLLVNRKEDYIQRIDQFIDKIYVDEVQDFASYDLDWLLSLVQTSCDIYMYGDYYQKTYASSRAGNKGAGVIKNFDSYKNYFEKYGVTFDTTSHIKSYRCKSAICEYVRENLNIEIYSHNDGTAIVKHISNLIDIEKILKDQRIKKLFYQKSYCYQCNSINWGDSKGQTYENVCVVLNKTTAQLFHKNRLNEMAATTKTRYYVACTRTRNDLYFIDEKDIPLKYLK